MKNLIVFLSIAMLIASCSKNDDTPDNVIDVSPKAIELGNQNNAFGFDVFKKLHEVDPDSNIFISPLSISTALAMTLNGAEGETKTEMLNTMRLNGWNITDVNSSFKELLSVLPMLDEAVKVKLANSIWYQLGFPFRQEFLDVNTEFFNSEVTGADFSNPATLDLINGWCEENTDGLIDQILDNIPPDAVMYLINAIYFKGAWTQEFDPENTYEMNFLTENGAATPVDMMNYNGLIELPYFETEKFQAVDLKYGSGTFSMSLFLPKNGFSIDDLMTDLNTENWATWTESFQKDSIYLKIPKFEMEYEKKLKSILKDLGMIQAFDGRADFSKMTSAGVNISDVIHKSFISVDEEGTEAAAITVVEIVYTSLPLEPQFIANKPFLFFIRDNQTNSVLFAGVMMKP